MLYVLYYIMVRYHSNNPNTENGDAMNITSYKNKISELENLIKDQQIQFDRERMMFSTNIRELEYQLQLQNNTRNEQLRKPPLSTTSTSSSPPDPFSTERHIILDNCWIRAELRECAAEAYQQSAEDYQAVVHSLEGILNTSYDFITNENVTRGITDATVEVTSAVSDVIADVITTIQGSVDVLADQIKQYSSSLYESWNKELEDIVTALQEEVGGDSESAEDVENHESDRTSLPPTSSSSSFGSWGCSKSGSSSVI